MDNVQEIFIENLKSFRKSRRITQAKLAEFCNVSNGTIGNIECGKTKPSFDLMVQMASVLNISVADFFISSTSQISNEQIPMANISALDQNLKNSIDTLKNKIHAAVDKSFDAWKSPL